MTTMPVVVGTDGSQESLLAVEWAALEAVRHGAPLRIVSAPAMPPRVRAYDTAPQAVANAARGMCARALGTAITRAEEVTTGLLIDTGLLAGPPAVAVTGSGAGALMLVVGARGAGGFTTMLLGSVSRYAAMHATCPVVVVREEAGAVTREVAAGIRDPRDTTRALAFAFEEAALRGATLVAVHSCYWRPPAPGGPRALQAASRAAADAERVSAEASRDLADALERWREKYPGVPVRMDVVHGHPARVLASYSARADLIVIGRHGGPAIGAVQHAVLHHARGAVAVVPGED